MTTAARPAPASEVKQGHKYVCASVMAKKTFLGIYVMSGILAIHLTFDARFLSEGKGGNIMKSIYLCCIAALSLAACAAVPRTADNVTLARIAKEAIGVGSIDEMEISNVQKLPTESNYISADTHYRYFVDTRGGKKFICDVVLRATGPSGEPLGNDYVKCDQR